MANSPAAICACLAVGIVSGLLALALIREAVESWYAKKQREKFGYKDA